MVARVTTEQIGLIDAAARAGVPLINVMAGSPAFDQLPGVFPDYEQAGVLRAEHLMSRGLRHFACISIQDRSAYHWQASAFAATVAAAGFSIARLDLGADWGETLPLYRKNQARIRRWMDGWELPIGVACATDVFARLLAQMARERGWRIPADVAIVGGTNEEQLCENPRPSLSSVEMGFERIGYETGRMLDAMMDEAEQKRGRREPEPEPEPEPTKPVHVILPPVGVVARESTDFFAVDDALIAQALAFIADQCHMHLDVGDIAEKLCVSVRTLQYRFARVLSRSVAQEIRRVRIEKAKRELTSSDRPISEIATRAGFTSNARLCEAFKREVGVTPGAYRGQRKTQGTE